MDFSSCPEISLGEWGRYLLAKLDGRRAPLNGTFEITERCNLGCVHCFINQPAGSQEAQTRELSTAEVVSILDQIADLGCLNLLLTGGEVLMRTDFPEIYRHAKQKGMLVTVFTNGTLLTERIADLLAELPPHFIEITLYGDSQETYERVTRVPGSFDRCRQGIQRVLERGLRLGLKAMVLTVNQHELLQMKAFAEQHGLPFRYDGMLWPRLSGEQQPFDYRLSPEQVVALDLNDPERMQKWIEADAKLSGNLYRGKTVFSCGAGHRSFHIDASGRLSLCMMARQPSYDLLDGSFPEGWEFLGSLRQELRQMDSVCRTCSAGIACVQCAGWSQLVHGDNETPVEYVCEVGRLRLAKLLSSNSSERQGVIL